MTKVATIDDGVATFNTTNTNQIKIGNVDVDSSTKAAYTVEIATAGLKDTETESNTGNTTEFGTTPDQMPSAYILNGLETILESLDVTSTKVLKGSVTLSVGGDFPINYNFYPNMFGFEALENGTTVKTPSGNQKNSIWSTFEYSVDGGKTWKDCTNENMTISGVTLNQGEKIFIRASKDNSGIIGNGKGYCTFRFGTGSVKVFGNVAYLREPTGKKYDTMENNAFQQMFASLSVLKSAEDLILPYTSVANMGYYQLFYKCGNLTTGPKELPASTLGGSAYREMFKDCSSLTEKPTMTYVITGSEANNEVTDMFEGCTSLSE